MRCPVCRSSEPEVFLHRASVPVHQNLLYSSPEEARAIERGSLRLACCENCGFVFNVDFDASKLAYGRDYENTQTCSPVFSSYVEELVANVASKTDLNQGHFVEVGCGSGAFLRLLIGAGGSSMSGHGYDPAYRGPEEEFGGRLRFTPTFFHGDVEDPANAVISRHVIEHIPEPVEFLRALALPLEEADPGRIFLETPNFEWILKHGAVWDLFYEHCSYLTSTSLAWACASADLGVVDVQLVFAGQYLWLEAVRGNTAKPPCSSICTPARRFAAAEGARLARLAHEFADAADRGRVVLWGAGAKGVTLANLLDPDAHLFAGVVDINPRKQGGYLPGTGHPILRPSDLDSLTPVTVGVLNPNYRTEIDAALAELDVWADLLDLEQGHGA